MVGVFVLYTIPYIYVLNISIVIWFIWNDLDFDPMTINVVTIWIYVIVDHIKSKLEMQCVTIQFKLINF